MNTCKEIGEGPLTVNRTSNKQEPFFHLSSQFIYGQRSTLQKWCHIAQWFKEVTAHNGVSVEDIVLLD